MTRGDVENVLLEVRADKINTWTIATVFLGNQPGGYKVGEMSLHTHTPHTHTLMLNKNVQPVLCPAHSLSFFT